MFHFINKNRFMVNISDDVKSVIQEQFGLENDEDILLVIDDSLFKNMKKMVVFTNKRIIWNYDDVITNISTKKMTLKARSKGYIETHLLKKASVFTNYEAGHNVIYILDENTTLIIRLKHFEIKASWYYIFFHYLMHYTGGYQPEHEKNEVIYKDLLKNINRKKERVFPRIVDIIDISMRLSQNFSFGKAPLILFEKAGFRQLFREPLPKLTEFWERLNYCRFSGKFGSGFLPAPQYGTVKQ
jgi:hypothetical protein